MNKNYRVSVTFKEPIFQEDTFVYVVKDMKTFAKENKLEVDNGSACYIYVKANKRRHHIFAFQEKHICWEIIAHECFHFALRLMEKQIRSIRRDEESFAYPCGMMVEIITGILRSKKIKIRDKTPLANGKGSGLQWRKNRRKKTLTIR